MRLRLVPIILTLGLLFVGSAVHALEGKVVDRDAKPIEGARVCYSGVELEGHCSLTDKNGKFSIRSSSVPTLYVLADDYLPQAAEVAGLKGAIVLERTPVLRARLLDDATGKPVGSGSVYVMYPNGTLRGPFPVSGSGVRIRRVLIPGDVLIRGEADGYRTSDYIPFKLKAGETLEVALRLKSASTEN